MKKVLATLLVAILMLTSVLAVGIGTGIGIQVTPEQFAPRLWMEPNGRVVLDDYTEPGAVSGGEELLIERVENYAFVGEQIKWDILVWDKNGIDKVADVYVKSHQTVQQDGYIEANCRENPEKTGLPQFEIYEGEELISNFYDSTMRWYTCIFTVETPQSMHGEYVISAEAVDLSGLIGSAAETELWFFNPVIALGVNGGLNFGVVRPGATVISSTITLSNSAEAGSGVMLDMFVAGTDFYDPSHSGAACPDSNVLRLSNFKYYASSGAYNTCGNPTADAQCYRDVPYYMDGAGAPGNNNFQRVIEGAVIFAPYPAGNVLSPGADMSLNFKLSLPEPCNGGPFDQGEIKFYGEAI